MTEREKQIVNLIKENRIAFFRNCCIQGVSPFKKMEGTQLPRRVPHDNCVFIQKYYR